MIYFDLICTGDDFRYDKLKSWDNQIDNYQQIMNYINSRKDWNVEVGDIISLINLKTSI